MTQREGLVWLCGCVAPWSVAVWLCAVPVGAVAFWPPYLRSVVAVYLPGSWRWVPCAVFCMLWLCLWLCVRALVRISRRWRN